MKSVPLWIPKWLFVIPMLLLSTGFVSSNFNLFLLHNDEGNTVRHLHTNGEHNSFEATLNSLDRFSPEHVPAYYLQLSLWAGLTSLHYVMLRTMTLFGFVLSIAMMYRFARDLFDVQIALIATFIFSFSAFYIYFGHNIRMYPFIVMQVIGVLWSYWYIMVSGRHIRWYHWGLLWFWSVYGVYTHNLVIFPLLAIGGYHVIFAHKDWRWVGVIFTEVLAGITFLPWLDSALHGASVFENLSQINQSAIEVIWNTVFVYSNGFTLAGLALSILILWFPHKNRHFKYVITTFFFMLMIMLMANELVAYIPFGRMRYTLVWFPSIALIWALGWHVLTRIRRVFAILFAVGWVVMLAWFAGSNDLLQITNLIISSYDKKFPMDVITTTIRHEYSDFMGNDNWIVISDNVVSYRPLTAAYYDSIFQSHFEFLNTNLDDEQKERLSKIDNQFPGFWFGYRTSEQSIVQDWLGVDRVKRLFGDYVACLTAVDNEELQLVYYLRKDIPCDLVSDLDNWKLVYDNGYILRNSVVSYQRQEVDVALLWNSETFDFDNSYGYSLQIFRNGKKVGQADYPIDKFVTHTTVSLTESVAGDYSVQLIVYSSDDISSVSGQVESGAGFERETEIANFQIAN